MKSILGLRDKDIIGAEFDGESLIGMHFSDDALRNDEALVQFDKTHNIENLKWVRFGSDWQYPPDYYDTHKAKLRLLLGDTLIPENIFQTHYLSGLVQKHLPGAAHWISHGDDQDFGTEWCWTGILQILDSEAVEDVALETLEAWDNKTHRAGQDGLIIEAWTVVWDVHEGEPLCLLCLDGKHFDGFICLAESSPFIADPFHDIFKNIFKKSRDMAMENLYVADYDSDSQGCDDPHFNQAWGIECILGYTLVETWLRDHDVQANNCLPERTFGLNPKPHNDDPSGDLCIDRDLGYLLSKEGYIFPPKLKDIGTSELLKLPTADLEKYIETICSWAEQGHPNAALVYGQGLLGNQQRIIIPDMYPCWTDNDYSTNNKYGVKLLRSAYTALGRELLLRRLERFYGQDYF